MPTNPDTIIKTNLDTLPEITPETILEDVKRFLEFLSWCVV